MVELGENWEDMTPEQQKAAHDEAETLRALASSKPIQQKIKQEFNIILDSTLQKKMVELAKIMPTKEKHYARNKLNNTSITTKQQAIDAGWTTLAADCHQFSSPDKSNVKYVSPGLGYQELVFDKNGNLVTDPRDMGTYNYSPVYNHPIIATDEFLNSVRGHFIQDVLPWLLWGNSAEDSTTVEQRCAAYR